MQALKKWLMERNEGLEGILFLLGVFFKPFYLFPSGTVGLADLCFAFSALILLGRRLKRRQNLGIEREDWLLWIFLISVCLVNAIWFFLRREQEYIVFTIYWIYGVMVIWSFRQMGGRRGICLGVKSVLKVSLLLQMIFLITGIGRIYYEYWGATRYMGTFNNPNQMAYVIFLMLLLLHFYEEDKRRFWCYGIIAGILIAATKSTGVFLGWACLALFDSVSALYRFSRKNKKYKKIWLLFWLIICVAGVAALWAIWPSADFQIENTDYSLKARIQEKIYKLWTGGAQGLIYDRGWERLILYPKYLLFGAGEGDYGRFPLSEWKSEIHSTFLSIWFYYGTIPLAFFLIWLYRNVKRNFYHDWPVYAALFFECMTVINYRQPFFWMVILAGGVIQKGRRSGGNNEERNRVMAKMDKTGRERSRYKGRTGKHFWER